MIMWILGIILIIIIVYCLLHSDTIKEGLMPNIDSNKYFTFGNTSTTCKDNFIPVDSKETCKFAGLRMGISNQNILTDVSANVYTDLSNTTGNYKDNNYVWFVGNNNDSCKEVDSSLQGINNIDMCKKAFDDLSANTHIKNDKVLPYTDKFMHLSSYCNTANMTDVLNSVDVSNNLSFNDCVLSCHGFYDCSMILYDTSYNICYQWNTDNTDLIMKSLKNEDKCNITAQNPVVRKLDITSPEYTPSIGCTVDITTVSGEKYKDSFSQLKYTDKYSKYDLDGTRFLCQKPYSDTNCYITNIDNNTQILYDETRFDGISGENTYAVCLQDNSYNKLVQRANKGPNGYGNPLDNKNGKIDSSYYAIRDPSMCERIVNNGHVDIPNHTLSWGGVKNTPNSLSGCYVDNSLNTGYFNISQNKNCPSDASCNEQYRLYLGTEMQPCMKIQKPGGPTYQKFTDFLSYTNVSYANNDTDLVLSCGRNDRDHEMYSEPDQFVLNCNYQGDFTAGLDKLQSDKLEKGDISLCKPVPVDCTLPGVFSEWSGWSECSKRCDGGSRTRTRTVTTNFASIPYYDHCKQPRYTRQDVSCNLQRCSSIYSEYDAGMSEITSNVVYGPKDRDYKLYNSNAEVINNCNYTSYNAIYEGDKIKSCPSDNCITTYDGNGKMVGSCCPFNYIKDGKEAKDAGLKFWRYDDLTEKIEVPWDCSGGSGKKPNPSNSVLLDMFMQGFNYLTNKIDTQIDKVDDEDKILDYNLNPQMSTLLKLQSIQKDLNLVNTPLQTMPDSDKEWQYPASSNMPTTFAEFQQTYSYTNPEKTILAINNNKQPYPLGAYSNN